jgi:hypothetical protein
MDGGVDGGSGGSSNIIVNDLSKGKADRDDQEEESTVESDALTYRGIYLPTLTNRFNDKKLETAYQRYACRQVRKY